MCAVVFVRVWVVAVVRVYLPFVCMWRVFVCSCSCWYDGCSFESGLAWGGGKQAWINLCYLRESLNPVNADEGKPWEILARMNGEGWDGKQHVECARRFIGFPA